MRATTAFDRIIAVDGVVVEGVTFAPEGVMVKIRRRKCVHQCPCGWTPRAHYDRSTRRWRHLDLGLTKCFLEAEICRINCSRCRRVRTEDVPWARPGARHTNAFCAVVAWLAQRVDKTTITKLLHVSWEAVAKIVTDVVGDVLDDSRFEGLRRIGVDEVSFRKGHRYLTVVADHDHEGRIVRAHEGKSAAILCAFYDEIGEERVATLEAISLDMGAAFERATSEKAPHVRQCVDPFHLITLANEAINPARRWSWNEERRVAPPKLRGRPRIDGSRPRDDARWTKHTRWALLKDPDNLSGEKLAVLHELRRNNSVLYRSWQLKEALRDLYRLRQPKDARAPRVVVALGQSKSYSRLREVGEDRAAQPRAHRGGDRAQPFELETRRPQLQDPTYQSPGLRTPLGRGGHRHDLSLLRRTHHRTTHVKSRRMTRTRPHQPEENLNQGIAKFHVQTENELCL
jgi:transposase